MKPHMLAHSGSTAFQGEWPVSDTYGHIRGSRTLSGGGEASQATGMGAVLFKAQPEPWTGETEACGHPALEPEASMSFLVLPSARRLQLNRRGPLYSPLILRALRPGIVKLEMFSASLHLLRPQSFTHLIFFFNQLTFLFNP